MGDIGGVAGLVPILQPLVILPVFAAVFLEAVLVEIHPADGRLALGDAAQEQFGRIFCPDNAAVAFGSAGVMIDSVNVSHVGNLHQSAVMLPKPLFP